MQCVILAGGMATRLRPITNKLPKSLVPVGDKPFISYQLDWLKSQGVEEILICTGYMGEMIRNYVNDGQRWKVSVSYSDEGATLLGTAGALRLAYDRKLLQERFFVTYGDSFLPIKFIDVWQASLTSKQKALMTVFMNRGKWDQSNVCFENGKILLYDKVPSRHSGKPLHFIDYGLSVIQQRLVSEWIPSQEKIDLATIFHKLSLSHELAGFEVFERFYEIGSPSGLNAFREYLFGPNEKGPMEFTDSKKEKINERKDFR